MIGFTLFLTVTLFSYVFLVEQNKELKKDKVNKEEVLLERTNKLSAQLVEVQKLSSKERITKIAKEKLGLVNPAGPFEILKINNNTVNTVAEVVRELNE